MDLPRPTHSLYDPYIPPCAPAYTRSTCTFATNPRHRPHRFTHSPPYPVRPSSLHTHKLSSDIVRAPCPAPTCGPTACPRSWGWAEMAIMMGASLSSPREFDARSWLGLMSSRLLLFWCRTLRRWPSFVPTGYNIHRELSCGCLALSAFHLIEFCP